MSNRVQNSMKWTQRLNQAALQRAGRGVSAACLSVLLTGCITPGIDMRPVAGFFNEAPVQNRPVTRPMRAITSFSESLACMDRMLMDQGVGTTLITSKDIPDPTSKAAVATKQMIITTLSQMSRVSNTFRYVDYEVDLVRQDTVQNLTGILLNANKIQLQRPALYISGAVSYVDQGIMTTGEQAGTSASRLELGYSADRNATLIGLELHLGDFKTRTLVPGIDSANDIVFGSRGQGLDAAARISRYGVQFNVSRTTSMGAGAAVRTLVELGLIEIVGKWARVPYWQCLMIDRTNPAFERQFKDWFDALHTNDEKPIGVAAPERRTLHAKRALKAAGYYDGDIDSAVSAAYRMSLARYQSDRGLIPSGDLTFPTFEHLFRSYVRMDEAGQLQRVGWGKIPTEPKPPVKLEVAVANQKFIPGQFVSGERIYLTANTSREAFLYCFYQDAGGKVSRLFPNPFQRASAVPGNRVVRIPDWLVLNPGFNLRAVTPGKEFVNCYASEQDIFDSLPAPLRATAILPIKGVNSLQVIDQVFGQLKTKTPVTKAGITWQVQPQPAKVSKKSLGKPNATVSDPTGQKVKGKTRRTKPRMYKVRYGDVLGRISSQYDVPMKALIRNNGLCSADMIEVGQRLYIDPPGKRVKRGNCKLRIAKWRKREQMLAKRRQQEKQKLSCDRPKEVDPMVTAALDGQGQL